MADQVSLAARSLRFNNCDRLFLAPDYTALLYFQTRKSLVIIHQSCFASKQEFANVINHQLSVNLLHKSLIDRRTADATDDATQIISR
jgi:hypothetical protein